MTGHIGIAVPDVHVACKLFEEQGVPFVKKPDDGEIKVYTNRVTHTHAGDAFFRTLFFSSGKLKGLAFIQDPDGYWIEILSPNTMVSITS